MDFSHINEMYQRMAYYSTVGQFILDWGRGDLADLRNLLARDEVNGAALTSDAKTIDRFNAIGIDFYFHDSGQPGDEGIHRSFVATQRLAQREQQDGQGGYVAVQAYSDINGDGFFTPGADEGAAVSATITGGENVVETGSLGSTFGRSAAFVAANGIYEVVLTADTRVVGRHTIVVDDNSRGVEFCLSKDFGLTSTHSVPTMAADAYEPNEDETAAVDLGDVLPGSPLVHQADVLSISSNSDVDWFRFDVVDRPAHAEIVVGFKHADGDMDSVLWRQSGENLSIVQVSNGSTDTESFSKDLEPGTYFVNVYGFNRTTYYSLSTDVRTLPGTDDVGATRADARETSLNGEPGTFLTDSAIDAEGDVDLYQFPATAGQCLVVRTSAAPGNSAPLDSSLKLFDAAGNLLASDDDGGQGGLADYASELQL
jgi:hypothetical protein